MKPSFLIKTFLPVFVAMVVIAGIAYAVWTEPTAAPPGNNAAAPINVGSSAQYKSGPLGIGGLLAAYNGFWLNNNGQDVSGKVLTANAQGFASWQAGGGGKCFTYYCGGKDADQNCTDHGGTQKYCPSGFDQIYAMGHWGYCVNWNAEGRWWSIPPGGGCKDDGAEAIQKVGEAYVCCQ